MTDLHEENNRLRAELAMVKAKLDSALQAVEDQRLEKEIAEHALAKAREAMPDGVEYAAMSLFAAQHDTSWARRLREYLPRLDAFRALQSVPREGVSNG